MSLLQQPFVETFEAQYGIEQEHDRVYEALKVSTALPLRRFLHQISEGFLENYKENEARELEHPVLFEEFQNYLKDISDKGGRHFWGFLIEMTKY